MKTGTIVLAATIAVMGAGTMARAQTLSYPKTAKVQQVDNYFGTKVSDPYRWLEDDNSAQTKAWVEAENAVTFGYLNRIPYRAKIKSRLEQLANYARFSGASQKAGLVFFYKNDGLQNQSVLYVQKGLTGTPDVLIDPNTLSADGTTRLGGFFVSKDGKYAAYALSKSGSDWQEMHVMEIATKKTLPETLEWVKFSGADWKQSEGFYYSRYPAPAKGTELTAKNENQKVYFHKVGTPQSDDTLVYEDTAHPDRSVGVGLTEDEKFELLYLSEPEKRGNALFFRPMGSGDKPFTPIVAAVGEDLFASVDNVGDTFLIATNQDAPNSKVVLFNPQTPDIKKSKVVIPEKAEPFASVSTAGGKIFVSYLKDVQSRVEVYDYSGKKERDVVLPAPGAAGGFSGDKNDTYVFYGFTSYNYPATLFRYDIATGKSEVFHAPEIKGFASTDYDVRQDFFKSKDGTRIPIFVISKKGLLQNGKNPTLLYGYGGFNVSLTPGFSALQIAWLEQGGVYAVVNLRGGGEYGEKWHEAGMRSRKQNVFDDCIGAAEWLISEKYTAPSKLVLQGGSNGGLLVGAVVNQRPDLFAAALPEVGVMDMLRFQKFTAGKFWTAEYGSSDNKDDFAALYKYSPLHNIKPGGKYPALLITTADHDDRVVPAHSFKYAATLQEKASHDKPLLIRIETQSGHGSSNLSKAIEETADVYAFLFYNLGVTPTY